MVLKMHFGDKKSRRPDRHHTLKNELNEKESLLEMGLEIVREAARGYKHYLRNLPIATN